MKYSCYITLKSSVQSKTISKIFSLVNNSNIRDVDFKRYVENIIEQCDNELERLYKDYENDKED